METERSPAGPDADLEKLLAPKKPVVPIPTGTLDEVQTTEALPETHPIAYEPPGRHLPVRWIAAGLVVLAVLGSGTFLAIQRSHHNTGLQAGDFAVTHIPLAGLEQTDEPTSTAESVEVNGSLQLEGSLLLTPELRPSDPQSGQIYYDKTSNLILYYNGQQFQDIGNSSITNVTNITNILAGSGNGVQLQAATPGTQQIGSLNISGTGVLGTLQTAAINSPSTTMSITNITPGGQVSIQADGFTVQDASTTHQSLKIDSAGAATFSNRVDSTAAFQVQSATNKNILTVDTSNNLLVLGNDGTAANVSVAGIRGGAVSGNNLSGKDMVITAGNGTGTGGSGSIVFRTASGVPNPLVTFDTAIGNENGNVNSISWSHTTGNHNDRIMIVTVDNTAISSPQTATSVTYNGQALTLLTSLHGIGNEANGSVWYLINPPVGTYTVNVTLAGTPNPSAGVSAESLTFYNVDTSDPIGGFTTNQVESSDISTTLTNTNTGQGIFDAVMARGDWGFPAAGPGQTQLFLLATSGRSTGSFRQQGDAGSTNMSWTSTGGSSDLNHVVIAFNPEPNVTPDPLAEALRITQSGTVGISLTSAENAKSTITLGGSADRSISINQNPTTGSGHSLTIQAGTGAIGSNNGGNLVLQGGVATGTGTAGSVVVRPPTDSTAAFLVQNAASTAVLSVDTTNKIVTISTLQVTGNITIGGHIITGGSTPTIAAGSAACTAPTVTISGTDTAGTITVTTGTACASAGTLATITFATAFGSAPRIVLTPGSAAAQGLGTYVNDTTVSSASFAIGTTTAPASSTAYTWNYTALQ